MITQVVIDKCGLIATGVTRTHGVHGAQDSETYLVNIALPNAVTFGGVRVTKGVLAGADILIGMDIICRGDFAVTNLGGVTKFSFRIPSMEHIDFVTRTLGKPPRPQFEHGGRGKSRPKRPNSSSKGRKKK